MFGRVRTLAEAMVASRGVLGGDRREVTQSQIVHMKHPEGGFVFGIKEILTISHMKSSLTTITMLCVFVPAV